VELFDLTGPGQIGPISRATITIHDDD
jgi:hypothetical protein